MFKLIVVLFVLVNGDEKQLDGHLSNKASFATEQQCLDYVKTDKGRGEVSAIELMVLEQSKRDGKTYTAKFACVTEEEKKTGNDGSI